MLVLVGLAGAGAAVGALSRYGIMRLALPLNRWPLPIATLFINLTGALLLGWILTSSLPPNWQIFLGTGIMGGYTTFSTFNTELLAMLDEGKTARWWGYMLISVLGGLGFAWLGMCV